MSKRFTAVRVRSAFRLLAFAPADAPAQRALCGVGPAGHAHEKADGYSRPMRPDKVSAKPAGTS